MTETKVVRESYEDWLDREYGIPKRGSSQQRQKHMNKAALKRNHKAAVRARNLVRTGQGIAVGRQLLEPSRAPDCFYMMAPAYGVSWAQYVAGRSIYYHIKHVMRAEHRQELMRD